MGSEINNHVSLLREVELMTIEKQTQNLTS